MSLERDVYNPLDGSTPHQSSKEIGFCTTALTSSMESRAASPDRTAEMHVPPSNVP
jgi:hypothetical protein